MFEKGQLEFQGLPAARVESLKSLFHHCDLLTAKVTQNSREDFSNSL